MHAADRRELAQCLGGRHVAQSDFGEVGTWRRMPGAGTDLLSLQPIPMTKPMHGQPVPVPPWRARLLDEARTWLLTPWHHNARVRGAGVDCGQLLIACYVG